MFLFVVYVVVGSVIVQKIVSMEPAQFAYIPVLLPAGQFLPPWGYERLKSTRLSVIVPYEQSVVSFLKNHDTLLYPYFPFQREDTLFFHFLESALVLFFPR